VNIWLYLGLVTCSVFYMQYLYLLLQEMVVVISDQSGSRFNLVARTL